MGASMEGCTEIVELLLDRGAAIDCVDSNTFTPFLLASKEGRVEVVQLLLDRGAALAATDRYGKTSLHLALKRVTQQLLGCYWTEVQSPPQQTSTASPRCTLRQRRMSSS